MGHDVCLHLSQQAGWDPRGAVGAAPDLAKAKRATQQVLADAAHEGGLELVELDLAAAESA
jgi:hypothetical protein